MFRSLLRLRAFLAPYRGLLGLGIFAFLIARIFEAAIPLFLKKASIRSPPVPATC